MYDAPSDVLGVLIARASRQPPETFFRERIFEPLGMRDIGFSVPAAKLERLATSYRVNGKTGALEIYDEVEGSRWSRPPAFASWYSDPKEDMVAILMTQRAWASPSPPDVCRDFWASAYG
jgi:CubicO group peptidase (beta-lactamase class C family)